MSRSLRRANARIVEAFAAANAAPQGYHFKSAAVGSKFFEQQPHEHDGKLFFNAPEILKTLHGEVLGDQLSVRAGISCLLC